MSSVGIEWYQDYPKMMRAIYVCGHDRLKQFVTTKRGPIHDFEKDYKIIKYTLKQGPTAASRVFGISKQRCDQKLRKYYQYATKAIEQLKGE